MKYASVCSGVEAASLAWMPLGWEAVWFSEIEPFPCAACGNSMCVNVMRWIGMRIENLERRMKGN